MHVGFKCGHKEKSVRTVCLSVLGKLLENGTDHITSNVITLLYRLRNSIN